MNSYHSLNSRSLVTKVGNKYKPTKYKRGTTPKTYATPRAALNASIDYWVGTAFRAGSRYLDKSAAYKVSGVVSARNSGTGQYGSVGNTIRHQRPVTAPTVVPPSAWNSSNRRRYERNLARDIKKMFVAVEEFYDMGGRGQGSQVQYRNISLSFARLPVVGGGAWSPLPAGLEKRYCVLNLKTDVQCFAYSVAAHLHPVERNRNRLSAYKGHLLDLPDEVKVKDIPKIEKRFGMLVNVYAVAPGRGGYTPFLVYPYTTDATMRDPAKVVPLLLHDGHYSLITKFAQFARAETRECCMACLMPLNAPLAEHRSRCRLYPPMRMIRAQVDHLVYKEIDPPEKVLVADFECMLPADGVHVPSAWCLQELGGALEMGFGPESVADFLKAVMAHATTLTVCAFHNLRGYDSHLMLRHMAERKYPYIVDILPMSSEKVIGFTIRHRGKIVRFIDSASLMPASLDKLLIGAGLDTKLPYPYEYFDSWERYDETALPAQADFYSSLKEAGVDDEEYGIAQELMSRCATLRDYTMHYIQQDVVGLAQVLGKFRNLMQTTYGIDPCAYWSLPGVSWAAMLKMTGVALDTVPPAMYQWLESGVRGGLSVVSRHIATASPTDSVTYFDANNLYGWAMSEPLPVGGYEWVEDWTPAEGVGHILEVDLQYPEALHFDTAHQQYPLAVESLECSDGDKLCGTFYDKERYVLHERALQYYTAKGLVVTKIHKVLRFRESAWMRPYIEKNSALRAQAVNEFESDFFKLMNNAVFGKTLESPRNRSSVKAFTSDAAFEKFAARPQYSGAIRLGPHMVLGQSIRTTMVCNKVPAVGLTVLDLSKVHMAKWHYDSVMVRLPQARLCATDTDSFFYFTPGKTDAQVYEALADSLDTSNFPTDHPLYDDSRKKVPGYFKSEVPPPDTISQGVWLRAKMYSLATTRGETKKAKGIPRRYVKSHMHHDDFVACFESRQDMVTKPHSRIASTGHVLRTESFTKVGLSCRDNKRMQLDETHTLPYGTCLAAVAQYEF